MGSHAWLPQLPQPLPQRFDLVEEPPETYGIRSAKTQPSGDRKGGVVWQTQGSGKSLSMVFYTGKVVLAMDNPTILVITDRNDLDDQLFDTFAACKQLLRQDPVQAADRQHLKELLRVGSGSVVFTTIHKFQPDDGGSVFETLSERENIVVIADEAHRTQYGFRKKTLHQRGHGSFASQRQRHPERPRDGSAAGSRVFSSREIEVGKI